MYTNELIFFGQVTLIALTCIVSSLRGIEGLSAFVSLQWIIANLTTSKQIKLFGLHAVASDPYAVGATLALNIIVERFGAFKARHAINIALLLTIFWAIVCLIHIAYVPSEFDTSHAHYFAILKTTSRGAFASVLAFYFSQLVDTAIYQSLKTNLSVIPTSIRSAMSMSVSQFLDTVIFTYAALYGVVEYPWHIITVSYLIKIIAIITMTPLAALVARWIENKQGKARP